MNALSDAIRLREALLAERRAERAIRNGGTIPFPVVAKTPVAEPKPIGFLKRLRSIACL